MYVVDSGGRDSCVDVRSASELKPLSNTIFIGSSTGDKRLPIFAAQDFSINCMGMEGENYVVKTSKPLIGVDLSTLKRIVGNGHRGVIGSDFFDAKKMTVIDYENSLIVIGDHNCISTSNSHVIPLRTCKTGVYEIDVRIGDVVEPFKIDTGSNGSLTMKGDLFDRLVDAGSCKATRLSAVFGLAGVREFKEGRLTAATLSSHLSHSNIHVSRGRSNLIGNALLSRYTLTFDLPNRRIFLEPNQHFSDPEVFDRSGLRLLCNDGTIQINNIEKSSPAQLANLQIGDQIVKLNDRVLQAKDICWLRRQLRRSAESATEVVNLTILRSGREFTQQVKLVDFTKWQKDPSE